MKALARATDGLGFVAVLTRTLPSPTLRAWNLICELTHPPGTPPAGTFSKSCRYGSFGTWRTRACPVTPSAVAWTLPNCPCTSSDTVRLPSSVSLPFSGGGLIFGGGGSPATASTVSIGASFHSAFTSRRKRPLSSKSLALNEVLSPGDRVTSAGNTCRWAGFAFSSGGASLTDSFGLLGVSLKPFLLTQYMKSLE